MEEIGKILAKVLQPQFSRLDPPVVEVLSPLWSRIVGQALAQECCPVAFSAGTLSLAAEDPAWIEPLRQLAEQIRRQVNDFLGKPVVNRLKIVSARKLGRGQRALGHPQNFPLSGFKRRDSWHGRHARATFGQGLTSNMAGLVGRSRPKSPDPKRGKAV